MSLKSVEVRGRVGMGTYAAGSKSEHKAVMLTTPRGKSYRLRRKGAPSLSDVSLDTLVGKSIRASGFESNGTLLMQDWVTID